MLGEAGTYYVLINTKGIKHKLMYINILGFSKYITNVAKRKVSELKGVHYCGNK